MLAMLSSVSWRNCTPSLSAAGFTIVSMAAVCMKPPVAAKVILCCAAAPAVSDNATAATKLPSVTCIIEERFILVLLLQLIDRRRAHCHGCGMRLLRCDEYGACGHALPTRLLPRARDGGRIALR